MDYQDKQEIKKRKRKEQLFLSFCVAGLVIGFLFGLVTGKGAKRVATTESDSLVVKTTKSAKATETANATTPDAGENVTKTLEEKIAALPRNLTFVNEDYSIPDNYKVTLANIQDGKQVDKDIRKPLNQMLKAAEKDGLHITVCSAYRDDKKQTQVFNDTVGEHRKAGMSYLDAYKKTRESVALPGQSEHALGTAVDLISSTYTELDEKQANTKEAKWLAKHCAEYGFILRYPPEKKEITGIIYEPWHFRYVGKQIAREIMSKGITLEEYLGVK